MKRCTTCKKEKPPSDFPKNKRTKSGIHYECKECGRARSRKWTQDNPERNLKRYQDWSKENRERANEISRDYRSRQKVKPEYRYLTLARRYGETPTFYKEMEAQQEGLCLTCGQEAKPLVVDHCHTTGKVRGMLCRRCNSCLGLVGENPEVLENMMSYLKNTKEK